MRMRQARSGAAQRGAVGVIAALVVVLLVLKESAVVIRAGTRGVVFSKSEGVLRGTYGEGMHLIVPFLWDVIPYDVRSRTYTVGTQPRPAEIPGGESLVGTTADGQQVMVDISLRFHLDPEQVWIIHQSFGQDYVSKIIKPQVRSDARMVIASYPGNDIFSKERYALADALEKRLRADLAPQHIIVEEVLIRNLTFSPQFQKAIEQKQIAQQDALRMDYVVKKQEQEKQQAIILARGEAEAIRLRGQALASYPELVQWEYVNALPSNLNVVVTDAQTIINLGEIFGKKAAAPAPGAP